MKIYINTIEEKNSILEQSKYIHDFLEVVEYENKDGIIEER
jgi:hypothetical protein